MKTQLAVSESWYYRILLILGHLFFLSYLIGTFIFYKERVLNFDSAYYTFHLLIKEDFFIIHDRWISYLSQWFPLQVMKNGGSLQAFLQTYSTAFAGWFYLLFLVVVYGFKNITGGIFYALAMGLAIRYKFYAAISEVTFSLALGAVLVAWLTSKYRPKTGEYKPWFWGVALLIVLLLYGTHPVIIAPLLAFFGMDIVYHKRWKDGWYWAFIVFMLGLYAYKFSQVAGNEYESDRLSVLANVGKVLESPQDFAVYHIIKKYFETEYTFPAIILIIITLAMFWTKRRLTAIVFILANIAWLLVNLGTYSYLNNHMYIMIDGYLALFGLIWATPILFFVLRSRYRTLTAVLIAMLLGFSVVRIYDKHSFYTERLAMLEETYRHYEQEGKYKVRFEMDRFNWDNMWYPYEVPHESLMLSALRGRDSTRSLFVNYEFQEPAYFEREDKQDFLHFHHCYPVERLPQQYFNLPKGTYYLEEWVAWKD